MRERPAERTSFFDKSAGSDVMIEESVFQQKGGTLMPVSFERLSSDEPNVCAIAILPTLLSHCKCTFSRNLTGSILILFAPLV